MIDGPQGIKASIEKALRESNDVVCAVLIGSTATGTRDQYSDLDYFIYAEEPNWTRRRTLDWLRTFGIEPKLCYWSGIEKYHLMIEDTGVDFSIRAAAQIAEVATWPTIHFPEQSIIKDRNGRLAKELLRRDPSRLTAGFDNTLHGCLYHSLNCAIQLRRGEDINARCRFSGVIESFICVIERTRVGQMRWREPSRRAEGRLAAEALVSLRRIAYAASPSELANAIRSVLEYCEEFADPTKDDLAFIREIRSLLEAP